MTLLFQSKISMTKEKTLDLMFLGVIGVTKWLVSVIVGEVFTRLMKLQC
jgi:hypothetical protein